jgi:[acyl-carrier-protein] S-malonyltransferase
MGRTNRKMKPIAFMFPGVGSQYVGMGKYFYDQFKEVREIFEEASSILDKDLTEICFKKELKEELNELENAQVALLTLSTALYRVLRKEVGITPLYCLGHSLGEYSALCSAGMMCFSDAVHLVMERGQIISRVSRDLEGTMMWVINLDIQVVERVCQETTEQVRGVYVSAFDSDTQSSISGYNDSTLMAAKRLEEEGAIVYPLKLSGPFHSPLMEEAKKQMKEVLTQYTFHESICPVLANHHALPYNGPESIVENLSKQLVSPIRWKRSIECLEEQHIDMAVEVGPKDVLAFLMKKNSALIIPFTLDRKEDLEKIKQQQAENWKHTLGLTKRMTGISPGNNSGTSDFLNHLTLHYRLPKEIKMDLPLHEFLNQVDPNAIGISPKHTQESPEEKLNLPPKEEKGTCPLSTEQRIHYYQHQVQRPKKEDPSLLILDIHKKLEKERIEEIFNRLIKRHEALRTTFEIEQGQVNQRVNHCIRIRVGQYQSEGKTIEVPEEMTRSFDLTQAPLIRVAIVDQEKGNQQLIINMPAITGDIHSTTLILKEFLALYRHQDLPGLSIQYSDYCLWQDNNRESTEFKNQQHYWEDLFKTPIPLLELPTEESGKTTYNYESDNLEYKTISGIIKSQDTSAEEMFLSLYFVLLSKLGAQEDLVIYLPIAKRQVHQLQATIGNLTHFLPLRNKPAGEKQFPDFQREVGQTLRGAYENQDFQLEGDVTYPLQGEAPFMRIAFFYDIIREIESIERSEPGLTLTINDNQGYYKKMNFDLALTLLQQGDRLFLFMDYSTLKFKKGTIRKFINYYKNMIQEVTKEPNQRISEIELISEEQRSNLMHEVRQDKHRNFIPGEGKKTDEEAKTNEEIDAEFDF